MTAASGTSIETMTTAEDYFVKVVKPNMDHRRATVRVGTARVRTAVDQM